MTAAPAARPAAALPFARASAARQAASELASTAGYAGPAGHPRIIDDITAAVRALTAALRQVACWAPGPAARANLRQAAATAGDALPRLAAAHALARRHPAVAAGMSLAALSARDTRAEAAALLAGLASHPDLPEARPDGLAGLAEDIAGTLRGLSEALPRLALAAAEDAARHLHAAAFILDAALVPAGDACTRLELAGFQPSARPGLAALGAARLPDPEAFTPPDEGQIARHVRYAAAVTGYRTGQPPRDDRDRAWYASLAASDLAEAWYDEQQFHYGDEAGRRGHALCPDGRCPLAGDPPGGAGAAARAARQLAAAARARHLESEEHDEDCQPGTCPWDARDLPQIERAARALAGTPVRSAPATGRRGRRPAGNQPGSGLICTRKPSYQACARIP
jgi:hypothetical protein